MKIKILNILFFVIIMSLILVAIFFVMKKNRAFQLQAVKIYQNRHVTNAEIVRLAQINFSEDIFDLNLNQIAENILSHSMIKQVSVSRIYPSTLKIVIEEHQVITGIAGSEIVAVSDENTIIQRYDPAIIYDLPVITGIHFYQDSAGFRQPDRPEIFEQIMHVLRVLKETDPLLFHKIAEIHYEPELGVVFVLTNGELPIIVGDVNDESVAKKLNYFSTIYYHLLAANKLEQLRSIDLRFDGQAVVREKI